MISYILPTHNRPDRLAKSLTCIGRLRADDHAAAGGAEVIIVDNASDSPTAIPDRLDNGLPVRTIHLSSNLGAAARNVAAESGLTYNRTATGELRLARDAGRHEG